jgi:hypothetical protein
MKKSSKNLGKVTLEANGRDRRGIAKIKKGTMQKHRAKIFVSVLQFFILQS